MVREIKYFFQQGSNYGERTNVGKTGIDLPDGLGKIPFGRKSDGGEEQTTTKQFLLQGEIVVFAAVRRETQRRKIWFSMTMIALGKQAHAKKELWNQWS